MVPQIRLKKERNSQAVATSNVRSEIRRRKKKGYNPKCCTENYLHQYIFGATFRLNKLLNKVKLQFFFAWLTTTW